MPGPQPSSVAVLSRTVELTDAEIKTLPSSSVVIVPATQVLNYSGLPTELPLPLAFSVSLDTSAGAYGNLDLNTNYVLTMGSDWSWDAMEAPANLMPQLDFTVPQVGVANTYDPIVNPSSQIIPFRIAAGSLFDNALGIALNNGSGNLTNGNPANTMKVTVLYTILDV